MKYIFNTSIIVVITILSLMFNVYYSSQQTISNDIDLSDYNDIEIMPISEVKRGMKGYGYSIFSGSVAQRFDADILGVIDRGHNTNVIMVKLSNNEWIDRANVSKGMSGSPVFIDDKLVGAVALTYSNVAEPIGFLRPIGEMLELLDREALIDKEKKEGLELVPIESVLSKDFFKDFNAVENIENEYNIDGLMSKYIGLDDEKISLDDNEPHPIVTPVMVSGLSDEVLNLMSDTFSDYGFELISSGEGNSEPIRRNSNSDIKPGDTIGLQYMRGDLNATSIGTLTYRKDDKVLFFGHKALNVGKMDMPLIKGFIYTTVPMRTISFKYGKTVEEIGKATYDFEAGVVGELGKFSKMIPVSVKINNGKTVSTEFENSEIKRMNYNFEIAPNDLFFPGFLTSSISQSLSNAISKYGEYNTEFTYSVKVKNLSTGEVDTVTIADFISSRSLNSLIELVLSRITLPTSILLNNYYTETEIVSINFEAGISHKKQLGYIEDVIIADNDIYAGKDVSVLVKISTEHGETIDNTIKVRIPEYLKEGQSIAIRVSNRKGLLSYLANKNPSLMRYGSYERLIDILSYKQDYSELVLWIASIDDGFIAESEEYPDLPESLQNIFRNHNTAVSYKEYSEPYIEKVIKTNYFITGYKKIAINLKGKK